MARKHFKKRRISAAKKGWKTRRKNERAKAAKKGWKTRRKNERAKAAKKGWKTRRRHETLKKKQEISVRVNKLDRERMAFRVKDQQGEQIEQQLAGKQSAEVAIRIETADGEIRERSQDVEIDESDPDAFWREYFEFVRDEIEDLEEEGYSYDEMGVTVTAIR